ncbi:MAG: 4-alpha-glucanotransferase [Armatimonadetes bacterium]|nr:4-alpha-glucanotransferase [Armatimonadota bacterium]
MESLPRRSGVLLHPTSLPGRHGMGDLGPASRDFIDRLAKAGQTYWQILPLGPINASHSPYQCLSSYAGSENLISVDDLLAQGLLTERDMEDPPHFAEREVSFERAGHWRERLLRLAYERFLEAGDTHEFNAWSNHRNQTAWLNDFALYAALRTQNSKDTWNKWPTFDKDYEKASAFYHTHPYLGAYLNELKWRQWVFFKQWEALRAYAREKGVSFIGDLPIYVGFDSCDVWAHRDLFELEADGHPEVISGVPPDYFSPTGQRWGNPLYDWSRMAQTGFVWWRNRLQHALSMFDYLRIDHFRGFDTYYEIPAASTTADEGTWRKGPGESVFHSLPAASLQRLIAEDLGEDLEETIALRRKLGIPGMSILQFNLHCDDHVPGEPDATDAWSTDVVVYTGTHDNRTALGWWLMDSTNHDRNRAEELCRLKPPPHSDWLQHPSSKMCWLAMSHPSPTCILPLQDVLGLGETCRMNTPGTVENNWVWRCRPSELDDKAAWDRLAQMTKAAGRAPAKHA